MSQTRLRTGVEIGRAVLQGLILAAATHRTISIVLAVCTLPACKR